MTIVEPRRFAPSPTAPAGDPEGHVARVGRRVAGGIKIAGTSATMLIARVPGTIHVTRIGAHRTTGALQTLPDSTLRSLAASSVGLGAGFWLAGAPRVVIAAGIAPALIMAAAMIARPLERSAARSTAGPGR